MYESAVIKPSEYHTAVYTLIDTSTPLIENPTDTGFYLVSNAAETEWGVVILSGTSPFLRVVTKKRVRLNTIYTGNVENYINLSQNYPEEPDITSYNWYTVTIP